MIRSFICLATCSSEHANIDSIQSFLALLRFKFHAVVFLHLVAQPAYVNKCFGIGIVVTNEAESFRRVKELNCSGKLCVLHGDVFLWFKNDVFQI